MVRRYEQSESLVTVGVEVSFNAGTVRAHTSTASWRHPAGHTRPGTVGGEPRNQPSIAKVSAGLSSATAGMKPYRPTAALFVKRMSRASAPSGSNGSVFSMTMT